MEISAAHPLSPDSQVSDTLELKEAVLSSSKAGWNAAEIPAGTGIVSSAEIRRGSSFTLADALGHKPGLSRGGDGIWATNINIRGLCENRLVTLIDRNRVETATDLTASLSMIDVNDIERVEVIYGAQSSIYGSGAIGGIINVVTKDGHFSPEPYFSGNLSTGFSSVNRGRNGYLSLTGGGERWYVKAKGSFAGAEDAMTPAGYLKNSGYNSADAGVTAAFRPAANHTLKAQFQHNRSWDVGIPGGASFSPQATASYRNIARTMASLNYELTELTRQLERMDFKLWYQGIVREVEMLPNAPQPQNGAAPTLVTPAATHRTCGANAESLWRLSASNTLTLGAEMWRRRISGSREKYIDQYSGGLLTAKIIRNEMPLPDASFTSAGVFAQDEARFLDGRLILSTGTRFDVNMVRNGECHNVESIENLTAGKVNPEPPGKYATFAAGSRTDPSWSANAGLLFKARGDCDLVLNLSRSYRSPALEELFKFIDLSGNRIHFGNPSLKAEKGLGGDVGVRFHGERLNSSASVHVCSMRDMIVERKVNTDPSDVNDTLVLGNASRALLYGFDAGISYEMLPGLKVYGSLSWTIGRELPQDGGSAEGWLPSVPPLDGRAGVSYENMRILGADLSLTAAAARKSGHIAQGERPTEAWCRLDFAVHSKVFHAGNCSFQLFSGIDNITDAQYTNFLSTNRGNIICEPGRNFFLRLNITFR